MLIEQQKKLAKKFEGTHRHAYRDSKGIITIGIGRNVDMKFGGPGLRMNEIDYMLENDLHEAEAECIKYFRHYPDLPHARQAVIVDMCFNMGLGKLLEFRKMHRALAEKDYDEAVRQMLDSKWARDVGPHRTDPLTEMMRTGVYVKI